MDRFRADLNSPTTAERVEKDQTDGLTAGVQGTPTFFLNGRKFEPNSYQDLTTAIDVASIRIWLRDPLRSLPCPR
ncbi:DsbA family protein [Saccharopolyspora sp. 5N708]|uniref:DsbA family protein n=1 Tax=Saccharopolyspora sp. 5N708 TaxID=3457424 RepID=UPI003FD5D3EA